GTAGRVRIERFEIITYLLAGQLHQFTQDARTHSACRRDPCVIQPIDQRNQVVPAYGIASRVRIAVALARKDADFAAEQVTRYVFDRPASARRWLVPVVG